MEKLHLSVENGTQRTIAILSVYSFVVSVAAAAATTAADSEKSFIAARVQSQRRQQNFVDYLMNIHRKALRAIEKRH